MKRLVLFLFAGISAFTANLALAENIVKPVLDVTPEYPEAALRRDASGYVVVRFDVSVEGKAENISVIEASHERLFDSAVKSALLRSTFEVEGQESAVNIERTYRFTPLRENNQVAENWCHPGFCVI